MPGRNYSAGSEYRYGFNGQEKGGEISEGNLDFGARIYDGRLGKFLSIDPYYTSFPFYSVCLFAGNSPVKHIDEDGGYKIDGAIKSKYPRIYKYLVKQLEKEMLGSALVAHGFKQLNPKISNDNLTEVFTNGTGPTIIYNKFPGGYEEAVGKYDSEDRLISINEKVFSYVEGVLMSKKSTKEDKVRALYFLKITLTHETGHDVEKMYGGFNEDGSPKMARSLEDQRKLQNELNIGEAGYEVTEYIYDLPPKNSKNASKKDLIPGLKSRSDAIKTEVLDILIKNAQKTEEGKKTLPSVPPDN